MSTKDIFIESQEDRLRELNAAASALCEAVERYVCPKRGDKTCLRSELLNTKERLREVLKR